MHAVFTRQILHPLLVGALVAVVSLALVGCDARDRARETVSLGDNTLLVWVADTRSTRNGGLNGFDSLGADEGMLFVYEPVTTPVFGIKDVGFPIEVVFIAEGGAVSAIVPLSPGEKDRRITGPSPSRYVLEVPQGWCDDHGVAVGSPFAVTASP